jgi:hypothetical protein
MTCPSCGGTLEAVVDLVGELTAPTFCTIGRDSLYTRLKLMKFYACNACEYCVKAHALKEGQVA